MHNIHDTRITPLATMKLAAVSGRADRAEAGREAERADAQAELDAAQDQAEVEKALRRAEAEATAELHRRVEAAQIHASRGRCGEAPPGRCHAEGQGSTGAAQGGMAGGIANAGR
jgi:hypothetical protein